MDFKTDADLSKINCLFSYIKNHEKNLRDKELEWYEKIKKAVDEKAYCSPKQFDVIKSIAMAAGYEDPKPMFKPKVIVRKAQGKT